MYFLLFLNIIKANTINKDNSFNLLYYIIFKKIKKF